MSSPLAETFVVDSAEWDELALRGGNVFATRQWLETWLHHRQQHSLLIGLVRKDGHDGGLSALLPLVVTRRRPTLLRPLGPWPAPALPLVCAHSDRANAGAALAEELVARSDWDVLQTGPVPTSLPFLPGRSGMLELREPNPILELGGRDWDDVLASRSRSFRKEVGQRERQLQRDFKLGYRLANDPTRLKFDLDELFRLHRLRWGDHTTAFARANESFYRDFIGQALQLGWLRLWFLELDGATVAVKLNFRYGSSELSFQSGRDPAYSNYNVGEALLVHAIREAANSGLVEEYRLMHGAQAYKRRYANKDDPVATWTFSRTPLGRAAVVGNALRRRMADAKGSFSSKRGPDRPTRAPMKLTS